MTLAVVTSATCTALPCRCDDRVRLETRGRSDSALHFILHFCIFLTGLIYFFSEGLKTLNQVTLCDLNEKLKAKDARLLIQLCNAPLFTRHCYLKGTVG